MSSPSPRAARGGSFSRLVAMLCATALLGGPAAAGASTPGLVVIPHPLAPMGLSYFTLTGRPGSAAMLGSIELRNPTARTLSVALAAVDGRTLSTLGSGYAPAGARRHRSTRWLRIGASLVRIAPGASARVPVSVTVPSSAVAGDYLSGVSIEALGQRAQGLARKGVSIASAARYAIGVEVAVPGARRPLIAFSGAQIQRQPAGLSFLLDARNLGNVILAGVHGHVTVTRGGRTVVSRTIEPGTFVTHTGIELPVPAFGQNAREGTRYGISAWLAYPGGVAHLHTSVVFGHREAVLQQHYGHPLATASGATAWWKIAGLVAVVLYALFTTVLLLRRRDRRSTPALQG